MSGLTLYTDKGNFRAFKILIAAEYNNVDIAFTPDFKVGVDTKTPEFLKLSPTGKVPVLSTPQGALSESNAIARYIARYQRDSELYGCSFFESGQVDSWVDFCSHDLELPVSMWIYPVFGYMPYNAAVTAKAKADVTRALQILENHLSDKTFLVGHKVTLADITVVSTLVYPFKFVADAAFRAPFPNVMRWFDTCVNQANFQAVIGKVVLCAAELTSGGEAVVSAAASSSDSKGKKDKKNKAGQLDPKDYPKKEKAPKQEKAKKEPKKKEEKPKEEAEAEEEEEAPKAKKEDHPFKIMDKEQPSSFVMDTWKKTYSNCETYEAAMAEFWETFDPEGWSIFRGDYMYDEDNSVLFMTSNLIAGFIQRTEEIRKWLFGTMTIRGEVGKGSMHITAYFLIRGDSMQPLVACNDDAEFYKWTKMEVPASDADKKLLFDYWTSDAGLEGQPCLDSRVYK